jgi:transposase InsO family protein
MPWETASMSQRRAEFLRQIRLLHRPVSRVCADFGISRKTAYKWLKRFDHDPNDPLTDRSRQPHGSPRRCRADLEQAVLQVRDQFSWGPRKIHAYLRSRGLADLPSMRTLGSILRRHGRVAATAAAAEPPALQRFERAQPNELWQCDFKGWLEVQRQRLHPFTVLDDHSRFLLALRPCTDVTMNTAWNVLWDVFAEYGLPQELLCDNAFAAHHGTIRTLSWFEARLLRLGIRPCHGRPYHPQTQGKLERLHGTLDRELWPTVPRDAVVPFTQALDHWRQDVYNVLRPHEALGDEPPLKRWQPSSRPRPPALPPVHYPAGALLRKVSAGGDVSWRGYRLLAGQGLAGQHVHIEERDQVLHLGYAGYVFRKIPVEVLRQGVIL